MFVSYIPADVQVDEKEGEEQQLCGLVGFKTKGYCCLQ